MKEDPTKMAFLSVSRSFCPLIQTAQTMKQYTGNWQKVLAMLNINKGSGFFFSTSFHELLLTSSDAEWIKAVYENFKYSQRTKLNSYI